MSKGIKKIYSYELMLFLFFLTLVLLFSTIQKLKAEIIIAAVALLISLFTAYLTLFASPKIELIDGYPSERRDYHEHSFILINHGTKTGAIVDISVTGEGILDKYWHKLTINGIMVDLPFPIKPQDALQIKSNFELVPDQFIETIEYRLIVFTAHGQKLKTEEHHYHTVFCECTLDERTGNLKSPEENCPRCGGFGYL